MKNIFIILLSINLLFGCSANDNDELSSELKLKELLNTGVDRLNQRTNNFNVYDGSYITISDKVARKSRYHKMPVTIFGVAPMSIDEILKILEEHYGVHSLLYDIQKLPSETQEEIRNAKINISFEGSMEDFLSYLGSAFGAAITLDNNKLLEVRFYVSKTYHIDQYLDEAASSASLTIGGGEGTSGGFSGSASSETESTTWEKIEEYLDDTVGEEGTATILEDFSIVNVTARPWIIAEIDDFFELLKKESRMQIAVQYRIISLSKSKLDQLALKLGYSDTNSDGYTIVSDIVDAVSLSKVGGGLAVNKSTVSSRLDAIVQSISQDVISKGQFVGLPNRVMPINLTTTRAYVAELTRETEESTGDEFQRVTPGEIVTGLSILILPKILDDGRIQLTSGFTEKRLTALDTFSDVQLPIIDETETLSTVTIDSGSIELIALYSENTVNDSKAIQFLGAGSEKETENEIVAVLIGADSYKLSSSVSKRG